VVRPVIDPRFGATLHSWRTWRHLSVRRLADLIFQGKTYVHDLETGKATPTAEVARRLDDALQAGGELAGMVYEPDAQQPAQQAVVSDEVLLPVVVNGQQVLVPIDSQTLATSGLGSLLREQACPATTPVDDEGETRLARPAAKDLTDFIESTDEIATNPTLFGSESAIGYIGSDTMPQDQRETSGDEGDTVRRRSLLTAGNVAAADAILSASTRVLQALEIAIAGNADDLGAAADSFDELVTHYSRTLCTLPPARVYDDLLSVRTHAGWLLDSQGRATRRRSDVVAAAGWLSNLLAVATSYLGDHAAALVWCGDAERRGREAGHPELGGWAALTKATIVYYQGQARRSVALASQGQKVAPIGTAAHAKLAAQEMRARAMLGDADGMSQAKRRATKAIAKLPPGVATSGVFSITQDEDPPYTATSLLLVRRFDEAVSATNRVIDAVYRPEPRERGEQSSNYARTLLILGLAHAGLRHVDEAAAAGEAALESARLVWPTMVLAGKLDQILTRDFAGTTEATDYHSHYIDAAHRATLTAPP
jgi:transcriptional regulator with XRE-family HTH domain